MSQGSDKKRYTALSSSPAEFDTYEDSELDTEKGHLQEMDERPRRTRLGSSVLLSSVIFCSLLLSFWGGRNSVPVAVGSTSTSILSSNSTIKKVSAIYGRGTWTSPKSQNESLSYLARAIESHKNQANLNHHEQVVYTTQLFGGILEDAYSKIGILMHQNFIEMNKPVEDRAKWLL